MTTTPPDLRVTPKIRDIMNAILAATPDDPAWALSICQRSGRKPGTIYPALARLMRAGWITDRWENPPRPGTPARCFYEPAYAPWWSANGCEAWRAKGLVQIQHGRRHRVGGHVVRQRLCNI